MTPRPIPDLHHIVRYCRPSSVILRESLALDEILADAFEFRAEPNGWEISVNWLEFLCPTRPLAVALVREAVGAKLRLRPNGRFAELNVGLIRAMDLVGDGRLDVLHRPLIGDPSHSGIWGTPDDSLQIAADLAALFRREGILHFGLLDTGHAASQV